MSKYLFLAAIFSSLFFIPNYSLSQTSADNKYEKLYDRNGAFIDSEAKRLIWLNPEDEEDQSFILVRLNNENRNTDGDSLTVRFSFDGPDIQFYLVNDSLTIFPHPFSSIPVIQLDPFTYEFKPPSGDYALLVFYGSFPVSTFITQSLFELHSDSIVHFPISMANRKITFAPVDGDGNLLPISDIISSSYFIGIRDHFTYGSRSFSPPPGNAMMITEFDDRFEFSSAQNYITENAQTLIHKIQFPFLNYLSSDTTLANTPADLVEQYVKIEFPPNVNNKEVWLYNFNSNSAFTGGFGHVLIKSYSVTSDEWIGKVVINNEPASDFVGSINFEYKYDNNNISPTFFPLRVFDQKMGGYYGSIPSPHNYLSGSGDTLEYIPGLVFASGFHLNKEENSNKIKVLSHFFSPFNKKKPEGTRNSSVTVSNILGDTLYSGDLAEIPTLEGQPEWHETRITNNHYFINGQTGSAELISKFNLAANDANPPILGSLKILNSAGKLKDRIWNDEAMTIQFSVSDFTLQDTMTNGNPWQFLKYKEIVIDSSKLFIKKSSDNQWNEMSLEIVAKDSVMKKVFSPSLVDFWGIDATHYFPAGIVYHVYIDSLENWGNEYLDLMVEFVDDNNNKVQYTLEPAAFIQERVTGISSNTAGISKQLALYQNYPNPFNPTTTIRYYLPEASDIEIQLYNLLGQKVRNVFKGRKNAGAYEVVLNMGHLPAGLYFYKLVTESTSIVKKCLLIK